MAKKKLTQAGFAPAGKRKPLEMEGSLLKSRPYRGGGSGIGSAMPIKGKQPGETGRKRGS